MICPTLGWRDPLGEAEGVGEGTRAVAVLGISSSRTATRTPSTRGSSLRMPTGIPFAGVSIVREAAATHHAGSNMCVNVASRMPMRTTIALWSNAPRGGTDSSAHQEGMVLRVQMTAPFACFTCMLAHPLGASWSRGLRKTHLVAALWCMNLTCHYLIPILVANIAGGSLCRTFRRAGTTWFCWYM